MPLSRHILPKNVKKCEFYRAILERWLSGRRHRFRKPATGKLVQGFKSLPLRRSLKRSFKKGFEDLSYIYECVTMNKSERCTETVRFKSLPLRQNFYYTEKMTQTLN